MPPALFALVDLEIGLTFLPRLAWTAEILIFILSPGAHHHAQFLLVVMGILQTFCLG
jgi:hypothetical protein